MIAAFLNRNAPLLACLIWGGTVLGIAAAACLAPALHTVYDVYSLASRRWWTGADIYIPTHEYYRYSPLFAVALTPLAGLPDAIGAPLWKVLNCVAFALGLGAGARRLFPAVLTQTQIAALFLLAWPLGLHSMHIGQANLLMLGAILLGLAAAAADRWNRAALWLALATLIKGYPLALALLMGALYPRRFPWRYAAALAGGLLLPFGCQRPAVVAAQYESWFRHMAESTFIMRERLRGLDHLFELAGHPLPPRTFALLELLAGLVVLGLCWRQRRRAASGRELLTAVFTHFALWTALFGPATESCTYVVMAPVLAWTIIDSAARPDGWGRGLALGASLLLMGPLVTDLFGSSVRVFASSHGSQPLGALLFLGCQLRTRQRVPPTEVAAPVRRAA